MTLRSPRLAWIIGAVAVALALVLLVWAARDLARTRSAVTAFARIVAAGNAGDLATVRALCTQRYQRDHPVELATGGGLVRLPRQIHPNFRAWVEGAEVWFCPANRVGIVYRFVGKGGDYKLDGIAGLLGSDGRVVPLLDGDGPADSNGSGNP